MPRKRTGYYETIEYIGPRPQKKQARNRSGFGGWVIVILAVGVVSWFGRPLIPFLKATQERVSTEQVALLMSELAESPDPGKHLAAAAIGHSREPVLYDNTYYKISYPNGDIPAGKGNAADMIIRCYRRSGIDLQKDVHEDMKADFRSYPQLWDALAPDPSIDHRRVANLARFFERKGESLAVTRDPSNYQPGDIVVWSLANAEMHIGMIVPGPSDKYHQPWVVHHMDKTPVWADELFDFQIIGHYRYPVTQD
jgi:uncharacterized protein YijF (DUF1287 family)